MSTTQIPPVSPPPASPPPLRRESGDLYDAQNWEAAYRQLYSAPALLVQLQDDLDHSRKREAFWISVVVHLVLVLLLVNSQRLMQLIPRQNAMVITPKEQQKDLTFLELPPDLQKHVKPPKTNILSDKDRVATSRSPILNHEDLKKALAGRSGHPGMTAPPPQPQATPTPQQQVPQPTQPPPPPPQESAKLQPPPMEAPKPDFRTGTMSPGAAINQAARATSSSRGGYGGEGGDYGLGSGKRPTAAMGPLEVLSDTMGVDFGPYLQRVLHDVKMNWYNLIPESARAPLMKKGKLTIEFAIMKDGRVQGMRLAATSGDTALDRGAWGGITSSSPFPPLPSEFGGQYLGLRFTFFYNPDKADLQ
ncbi:MAG TPA: TonB family protein [Terriglobales bacterium]|nr:TonB family protein [Terriglobales bacterium]